MKGEINERVSPNETGPSSRSIPFSVTPLSSSRVVGSTGSRSGRQFDEMRFREKTNSPEWDRVVERLEAEITTRRYLSSKMKEHRASILKV